MVRDFDNNFKEYLDGLMNEAMNELRSDNYSFMELEDHNKKLYESMEKVLEQLPGGDRKIIEDFLETSGMVKGQESDYMYYQGMRDAVRFLKFFRVT